MVRRSVYHGLLATALCVCWAAEALAGGGVMGGVGRGGAGAGGGGSGGGGCWPYVNELYAANGHGWLNIAAYQFTPSTGNCEYNYGTNMEGITWQNPDTGEIMNCQQYAYWMETNNSQVATEQACQQACQAGKPSNISSLGPNC